MPSEATRRSSKIVIPVDFVFRSIHTNYDAKFSCETIKLAVLKNPWLAKKFGGKTFDVLFRYDKGDKNENSDTEIK